jgi:hypothetical protein
MRQEQGQVWRHYRKYRVGDSVTRPVLSHLSGLVGLHPFSSYNVGASETPENYQNRIPSATYEEADDYKILNIFSRHRVMNYNPEGINLRIRHYRGIGRYSNNLYPEFPNVILDYSNSFNFNDPYKRFFIEELCPYGMVADQTSGYIDIAVMDTVKGRCQGKFLINILRFRHWKDMQKLDTIPVQGTFDVALVNLNDLQRKLNNVK